MCLKKKWYIIFFEVSFLCEFICFDFVEGINLYESNIFSQRVCDSDWNKYFKFILFSTLPPCSVSCGWAASASLGYCSVLFSPSDINECLTGRHNCARGQVCLNTEGSFHCQREISCNTGYKLTGSSCQGDPPPPKDYYLRMSKVFFSLFCDFAAMCFQCGLVGFYVTKEMQSSAWLQHGRKTIWVIFTNESQEGAALSQNIVESPSAAVELQSLFFLSLPDLYVAFMMLLAIFDCSGFRSFHRIFQTVNCSRVKVAFVKNVCHEE